jgi:AcrR family transcriptional regulator
MVSGYKFFLTFFDMPTKRSQPLKRRPRADAQRNRERILEVAKEAFTGSGANTSLDDIAKQAGIGPGTLYRHFPTREELLQAVYRSELEKLAAAERKMAQTMTPIEALRAWLLLFVDAIAAKELIAPALNTLVGDHKKVFEASYAQMHEAIRSLVKRAIKSGDIRKDLDPIDLLRALVGVANVATSLTGSQAQTTRRYSHHRFTPDHVAGSTVGVRCSHTLACDQFVECYVEG